MQLGADLELRLVASGGNGSDAQADPARGAQARSSCASKVAIIEMVLHWQGGDHTALQAED